MKSVDADRSAMAMSPMAAAMWTLGLAMLAQLCIAVTDTLRPGGLTDVVNLTACEVLATSVAVWAIVRVYAPASSLRGAIGLAPVTFASMVLSAVAGAGLCPLLSMLDDAVLRRWPYDDPTALANMTKLVERSPHVVLVLGVFVVVPLAREVFFRGVLFGQLGRTLPRWGTIVTTAVLFGVSSLDLRAMPSALVLGGVLGCVRAFGGSALAAAACHLSFWAVEAVPILAGRDPAADVTYPVRWVALGVVAAGAALGTQAVLARFRPAAPPAPEGP